jgi:hypothetical protein
LLGLTNAARATFVASNYLWTALRWHDAIVKFARILQQFRAQKVERHRAHRIGPWSQMRDGFLLKLLRRSFGFKEWNTTQTSQSTRHNYRANKIGSQAQPIIGI